MEILERVDGFVQLLHLYDKKPINIDSKGQFFVESALKTAYRKVFRKEDERIFRIADEWIKTLDAIEQKQRVPFSKDNNLNRIAYEKCNRVCQDILQKLTNINHLQAKKKASLIKRRYVALNYRIEEVNGGWNQAQTVSSKMKRLFELASKWKNFNSEGKTKLSKSERRRALFRVKQLTKNDIQYLKKAGKYPHFVDLILSDSHIRDQFFTWVVRDVDPRGIYHGRNVEIFVEFPAIQKRLHRCHIAPRLSVLGEHLLKVEKREIDKSLQKDVQILIGKYDREKEEYQRGDYASLFENKKIALRGNYQVTIDEIFFQFQKYWCDKRNFEMFDCGIVNCRSHDMLYYNADKKKHFPIVDLSKDRWWEHLPRLIELDIERAKRWFECDHLDGKKWVISANAARSRLSLTPEDCHAYHGIAVPISNRYVPMYFGRFAEYFPTTGLGNLLILGDTVRGLISYIDENIFYIQRQQTAIHFDISSNMGEEHMQRIKKDILKGRQGNLIFQAPAENCTYWVEEKIRETVKEKAPKPLYKMDVFKVPATGFSGTILKIVNFVPKIFKRFVMMCVLYLFGAFRSRKIIEENRTVYKSLATSFFAKTLTFYNPAKLFEVREENKAVCSAY